MSASIQAPTPMTRTLALGSRPGALSLPFRPTARTKLAIVALIGTAALCACSNQSSVTSQPTTSVATHLPTWTQQSPTTSPPARTTGAIAYDPAIGKLVLFGGGGYDRTPLGDTWTYESVPQR
jgi:hypothetical protein